MAAIRTLTTFSLAVIAAAAPAPAPLLFNADKPKPAGQLPAVDLSTLKVDLPTIPPPKIDVPTSLTIPSITFQPGPFSTSVDFPEMVLNGQEPRGLPVQLNSDGIAVSIAIPVVIPRDSVTVKLPDVTLPAVTVSVPTPEVPVLPKIPGVGPRGDELLVNVAFPSLVIPTLSLSSSIKVAIPKVTGLPLQNRKLGDLPAIDTSLTIAAELTVPGIVLPRATTIDLPPTTLIQALSTSKLTLPDVKLPEATGIFDKAKAKVSEIKDKVSAIGTEIKDKVAEINTPKPGIPATN